MADVGCGRGRALLALAQAFPESRFTGYDLNPFNIDAAIAAADAAGLSDRVVFRQADVSGGLSGQYDLITIFDTLHDLPDPLRVLGGLRRALKPNGAVLALEFNSADTTEGVIGMGLSGVLLYSSSLFYCLSTALARGGESLGAEGLPESRLRSLAKEAGFSVVNCVAIEHPINALYELRVSA